MVPAEIWQLTNLTELNLSHNQLTSVPSEFCRLTNLTTLCLDVNKLTSVPAEICWLTNLTMLWCAQPHTHTRPRTHSQPSLIHLLLCSCCVTAHLHAPYLPLSTFTFLALMFKYSTRQQADTSTGACCDMPAHQPDRAQLE
eukprot:TRINITY_DN2754_c0_g1_i8.p1 TRINITY_DN2754_c0_g1~~TRINITY_DN2754_c0_g1_i8.p1  ORF type:complete len:162 (-),score=11.96 TRINITY_DN2754_c0_g1_i8:486-908(-)